MIKFGILIISDRSSTGMRPDSSGPIIQDIIHANQWDVSKYEIIPDDYQIIKNKLIEWSDIDQLDVILTSGGTGFSQRDITPEATRAILDREAPGIVEAIRCHSLKITPHAMLSRAVSGIRKSSIIINLPGSPKAVKENLEVILSILPHAVETLHQKPFSEINHSYK
jgi:molybdenum cofactor synthesis domain-containing protein